MFSSLDEQQMRDLEARFKTGCWQRLIIDRFTHMKLKLEMSYKSFSQLRVDLGNNFINWSTQGVHKKKKPLI
jgi:hypothetical protein